MGLGMVLIFETRLNKTVANIAAVFSCFWIYGLQDVVCNLWVVSRSSRIVICEMWDVERKMWDVDLWVWFVVYRDWWIWRIWAGVV